MRLLEDMNFRDINLCNKSARNEALETETRFLSDFSVLMLDFIYIKIIIFDLKNI